MYFMITRLKSLTPVLVLTYESLVNFIIHVLTLLVQCVTHVQKRVLLQGGQSDLNQ